MVRRFGEQQFEAVRVEMDVLGFGEQQSETTWFLIYLNFKPQTKPK